MKTLFNSTLFSSVMMLVVSQQTSAFGADPGLGDVKVCQHVHVNGTIESQYATVQAPQSCPAFSHYKFVDGVNRLFIHTETVTEVIPKMSDPSSPTCYNTYVLLPGD
ncbi:hypothetical protein ACFODZ_13825 [Marinicella sediminis]|uniref:Uncharacterized protein n=1 Tax=Marinicella sediminis TaxID=1792834 RepID=A0ABV7JIX8_9GAMM|nr:hypothetical protein [Marinicella sediminis]